jgi:hypothetical protein
LTSLVKKIESAVEKNTGKRLAAFVVVLTEDADATGKELKALAKKEKIDNVPLTLVEGSAGPPDYKIAQDADVTVMIWKAGNVKFNHAFKKGELNDKAVSAVVADVDKVLE